MTSPATGVMSPRREARIAGAWYAALAVLSAFGILFVDARLYVPGDAAATAGRILADEWVYRLGISSTLLSQVAQVLVGLSFYRLFKSVDKGLVRTMLALVIAMVPVAFLNMLNKFAPLMLLGDPAYLKAFTPGQLQALAVLFIELQRYGTLIVEVFWGLWLLPLGLLVYKSGLFPRVLGVLLIVNCAAYLVDFLLAVMWPGVRTAAAPVINALSAVGEIPFLLWLLIRGSRNTPRNAPVVSA
ncbi:MAG: DUF4386 domain-containing protein [Spirochaetia bacterium]